MVINIPKVEPFTFQASTAFDERVQLADKLNEVIDALNLVGDIPDMQTEIDGLKQSVASLQESIGSTDTNLATVEGNLNKTISDLNALTVRVSTLETTVTGQTSDIAENTSEITGLKTRMSTAENGIEANKNDINTIEAKQTEHETEIQGLLREVVGGVAMSSTAHGTVQVTINHEDGTQNTSAPIDLGLVQEGGITLSTGATDRSFRLTVQLSDGSSWQTNDFVIPEGGGTEVVVTSVQIKKGSQDDMMKVSIGLSDGSSIDSNDWSFVTPTQFAALQSTVSTNTGNITSLTGRVIAIDSQLDTIDGSLDSLGDRVTALEGSPGYNLPVATASVLGGVKIGTNIIVQADGTISIPNASASTPGVMTAAQVAQLNTAAVGSTLRFTGDASKVTLHADSVAGSAFTEDLPAAADGGAGTIDQVSYQKIAATESALNNLAPTVTVNDSVSPPTITIGINGKTSKADLPVGGGFFTHRETDINAVTTLSNGVLTVEKDFLIMYFKKSDSSDNVQSGTSIVKSGTYDRANAQTYIAYSVFFLNINNSGEIIQYSTGSVSFSSSLNSASVYIGDLDGTGIATPLDSDFDLSSIPRGGKRYAIFT